MFKNILTEYNMVKDLTKFSQFEYSVEGQFLEDIKTISNPKRKKSLEPW